MSGASISCTSASRSWLKELMHDNNLRSYDDALLFLKNMVDNQGEDHSSASEDDNKPDGDAPRMFSTKWFSDDKKARKYYCGLKDDAFNWIKLNLIPKVTYIFLPSALCVFAFLLLFSSTF